MKFSTALLMACYFFNGFSQNNRIESKLYHDGHGGFVYFPLGSISFADELVSFTEGVPSAKESAFRNSKDVLREPDYDMETEEKALTLGCGGVIVVRFTDNALIDQPGPDLYIFETGSGIEPTSLSVSKDGVKWIDIGEISGGRADVDLTGKVNPEDIFYYVKLTDLKSGCGGDWPGSDVDAIGAIGSAIQITLSNSVLFDSGKSDLKSAADSEITKLIAKIKGIENFGIEVEGHTDSIGSDEANLKLSLDRANAVKNHFVNIEKIGADRITVKGYGEKIPLVGNNTEENRQKNRRVNIIINPRSIERKKYELETNTIFMAYKKDIDKCKNGYPLAFNNNTFPGIWTDGIDEALALDNLIYFFKGKECLAFNKKTKQVEGTPRPIGSTFSGLWDEGIDAVVNWGNGKAYFFKGNEYIRFDLKSMKADKGYPKPCEDNWGSSFFDNGVDCATNWGNGYAYFFKNNEYVKYNISEDAPVSGYPKSNSIWGSLWVDKIDGAFDYAPNEVYFLKNPRSMR